MWSGGSCEALMALARLRPTLTIKLSGTEEDEDALTACYTEDDSESGGNSEDGVGGAEGDYDGSSESGGESDYSEGSEELSEEVRSLLVAGPCGLRLGPLLL